MKKQKLQFRADPTNGMLFRGCSVDGSMGGDDKKTPKVRMTISSDTPCLTYVEFKGQYMKAYEILDHSESSIDRSRMLDGLIIQDTHHGDQIGLIRNVEIKDGKMGGEVEFCSGERAQEIAQDAANGLRKNSSAGYMVDPSSYHLEGDKDGIPVVRAMRWTPYEGSFVNVPADTRVGVGRELEVNKKPSVEGANKKEKNMTPKQYGELLARALEFGVAERLGAIVEANPEFADAQRVLNDVIINAQRDEIKVNKAQKVDPLAGRAAVVPVASAVTPAQMKRYSVMNALRSLAGNHTVDAGFEREVSQELAKERGKAATGLIIPFAALGKREFTVSGTSSATVQTTVMANEFIDLLRTQSVLGAAGVRFMTGLVGDVAIPKMTAGATGYWVAESGTITGSQPTMGQVTGTPHTCGVLVDISRKLLAQSTPSAEMLVRDEIMERIIRTIQIAVFAGTGADGQPAAITNATGINDITVTTGTPTYAQLLDFIGAIMADNAMADNQKWIGTGEVWAKLASTATNGAGSPPALDAMTNKLIGRDFLTTEDVPANSLWFGNWATVAIGIWGNGLDINADTATLSNAGGLRLVGLQDIDVMVRNGAALSYDLAVTS
jgi:HK97 family phage major capsid protein